MSIATSRSSGRWPLSSLPELVGQALNVRVVAASRVTGGDLNDAWRMDLADGGGGARGGENAGSVFVKTARDVPAGTYATEAAGLMWLAQAGALRVPEVLAVDERFLVLEWIEPGRGLSADGEVELGRGLAALHAAGAPAYGGAHVLRIGPLALPDGPAATWAECYAQQRLRPVLAAAVDRGTVGGAGAQVIERLCARMPDLVGPPEPPARLHGDLWSGNVLADRVGRPWLVDPAAYGGHREIDLAMLRLFGGPGERCFSAYDEAMPLADGHGDRVALWQVFPLLVHAALFGGGYGARAVEAAATYV